MFYKKEINMNIAFTTTAMVRPNIIDKTYKSFKDNLKGVSLSDCELYLNIDPLPLSSNPIEVVDIARKYFKNVIFNISDKANFTKAVEWCWRTAESDYIFHLEDDWKLISSINIEKLINSKFVEGVEQLALRAYLFKYDKMCLSPSVIKKRLYKSFVGEFDYNLNPEIQLRRSWVSPNKISVSGKDIIVKDIGRSWIKKTKYSKPDKKSQFTKWRIK